MMKRHRPFGFRENERRLAREIDDEIAFHIEERTAALIEGGLEPAEARRRAEREFGHIAAARAELTSIDRVTLRRRQRSAWWEAVRHDVRMAVRGMRRNVLFSMAVILALVSGSA